MKTLDSVLAQPRLMKMKDDAVTYILTPNKDGASATIDAIERLESDEHNARIPLVYYAYRNGVPAPLVGNEERPLGAIMNFLFISPQTASWLSTTKTFATPAFATCLFWPIDKAGKIFSALLFRIGITLAFAKICARNLKKPMVPIVPCQRRFL